MRAFAPTARHYYMTIEIPDEAIEDADRLSRALYAVLTSRERPPQEQKRLELVPRDDGSIAVSVGPKAKTEIIE